MDETLGNILKRRDLVPAPERKTTTTGKKFIRTHMDVLVATDFFTAEVWTLGGLCDILCLVVHQPGAQPRDGPERGVKLDGV